MKRMVEALLRVRTGPRPDPLPDPRGDPWGLHAPYLAVLLVVGLGALLMEPDQLGLLACGAIIGALTIALVGLDVPRACEAVHYGSAVLFVALFHGTADAGAFVPAAGLFLFAALGGRAAARFFSPSVAPLAGRVPWRFEDIYRHHALRFAGAGALIALVLVALGSNPALRILGVAMLPMALRSYAGQMLAPASKQKLWLLVASFEAVGMLLLVPSHGAVAAAWLLVVGETVLFIGSALTIAERTGVDPYPHRALAVGGAAAALVAAVAVPATNPIVLILIFVFGALLGLIFLIPNRNRRPPPPKPPWQH